MVGIYKITSLSGAINIGQSWNIEEREKNYSRSSCKGQRKLYNSIRKYGWKNHKFEIVYQFPEDITQEVLDNYEIFCINQFKEAGYNLLNLREGGSRGKLSEETKKLIVQNRDLSNFIPYFKNNKMSDEIKEKIREKTTGKSKGKGISRNKGRKITWGNKISEVKKGMKYNKNK